MAKSEKFSLKLFIDDKRNKVVFAEASQDFVDVLFSLLTLPMGKIVRFLENHKNMKTDVLGCYKNLNRSVADMGIDHFKTEAWKSMLLYPISNNELLCRMLKLNMSHTDPTKFFKCPNASRGTCGGGGFSNFNTTRCIRCGGLMSAAIPESEVRRSSEDGVFVNCRSSFIVTDDLKVSVNSIGVIMKVLNDLGYNSYSDLRETLLDVGYEEVLNLLGLLFTSEAPLTCAFLRKNCPLRMHEMLSPPALKSGDADPARACSVKVFVRKLDREILYAECDEDFLDSLLSFLVLPLELAWSLSNDNNTILGCVGNLCRSPCGGAASKTCHLPAYYISSNNNLLDHLYQASSSCGTGFMKKKIKFVVSNDLLITPMSSCSTIGLLKKIQVDISDLEEHQISISKAELISILRTSLISSSALTSGLSNLLVNKPKEET